MYPHRIRLRDPWVCEPLPMGARFRRRFGYPGRIDAHERVWLTFAGARGRADVWLNGHALGRHDAGSGPFEHEVTALLRPRNEVVVEVDGTAEAGRPTLQEVALEIRCTAFLRDLRRWADVRGDRADLHVTGRVVGVAERPLELYIVLNRSPAAYQMVTATAEGMPFHVVVPDLAPESWRGEGEQEPPVVKVDLVNGAMVWYTSEEPVLFAPTPGPGG
jgi:hypothetical protein